MKTVFHCVLGPEGRESFLCKRGEPAVSCYKEHVPGTIPQASRLPPCPGFLTLVTLDTCFCLDRCVSCLQTSLSPQTP